MKHSIGWVCSFLAFQIAVLLPAFAYDTGLSSESIRQGYFLGRRNDEKTVTFLASYIKRTPLPEKGPYVSEISLYTPYAQVVLNSSRSASYSVQQAEQDYRTAGDTIRVRVAIEFTSTFNVIQGAKPDANPAAKDALIRRSEDFWREFQYELRQKKKPVKPRLVEGKPIYSDSGLSGAEVSLEYEAKDVTSEEATFEVSTPDDHQVVVTFNLAELH